MQYGKKREYKTKGLEKNKSTKSILNHGRHNYIYIKSKSIYKQIIRINMNLGKSLNTELI